MASTVMSAEVSRWAQLAAKWGAKYNVNPSLVLGVIRRESQGFPKAKGAAGEYGLMQLHPRSGWPTFVGAMKERGMSAAEVASLDPWDPDTNIRGGAYLLGVHIPYELKRLKQADTTENRIISYNAGPGAVVSGKVPAITRDYVQEVTAFMRAWAGLRGVPAATTPGPTPPSWTKAVSVASALAIVFALVKLLKQH